MFGTYDTRNGYKRSLESRPGSICFKFFLSPSHHLFKQTSIQTIIQIMTILGAFVLFAIILKCIIASGDEVETRFWKAVDKEDFEWLRKTGVSWRDRRDLLDDVIAKGVDVTVRLIQSVDDLQNGVYLLHSLIRETEE